MTLNSLAMSSAIPGCGMTIDTEYQRIIRALRAYGIEPTGDKNVDKAKLQKIEEAKSNANAKFLDSKQEEKKSENVESKEFVDKGEGSDQIAMLNKLMFGLL